MNNIRGVMKERGAEISEGEMGVAHDRQLVQVHPLAGSRHLDMANLTAAHNWAF
jgi:hypothetical protein